MKGRMLLVDRKRGVLNAAAGGERVQRVQRRCDLAQAFEWRIK